MKREKISDCAEWLEQQPVFEGDNKEVFENADGSQYIPVGIVENLLDWFTDKEWHTSNFKFNCFDIDGKSFVSGSIELSVFCGDKMRRNLVGAATLSIEELRSVNAALGEKENTSFEATMLSLALCNAAKKLGNRFGRSLNGRGVAKVQADNKEMPLPIPDKEVIKIWLRYCTDGDTKMQKIFLTIYDNQTLHNALKK